MSNLDKEAIGKEMRKLVKIAFNWTEKRVDIRESGLIRDYFRECFPDQLDRRLWIEKVVTEKGLVYAKHVDHFYNHDESAIRNYLSVVKGRVGEKKYEFEKAYLFSILESNGTFSDRQFEGIITLKKNKKGAIVKSYVDGIDTYADISENNKESAKFVEAMDIIGFKKESVIDLVLGKKTAEEVALEVVPKEIIEEDYAYTYAGDKLPMLNGVIIGGEDKAIARISYTKGEFKVDCSKIPVRNLGLYENSDAKLTLVNFNEAIGSLERLD